MVSNEPTAYPLEVSWFHTECIIIMYKHAGAHEGKISKPTFHAGLDHIRSAPVACVTAFHIIIIVEVS